MPKTRSFSLPVEITGRFWVQKPTSTPSGSLILGLHGYGESGQLMLDRMIPWTIGGHTIASIEALHPIYLPNRKVGHSWMTSHLREEAIAENLRYIQRVLDQLQQEISFSSLTVFGYSQGAQMAMRVARWIDGVHLIALGAELPPELHLPPIYGKERSPTRVTLARGKKDLSIAHETFSDNQKQWQDWGADCTALELPGAHRWSEDWIDLLSPHLDP